MSNTGPSTSGPDPSSEAGQADPAEAFAAAMRDVWGFGASTLQAAASNATPGREDEVDTFRIMTAPIAGMLSSYAEIMARLAGSRGPTDSSPGRGTALSPALVEAASVAMGSTLRYGQGLNEVFARHQGNLAKHAASRMSKDASAASGNAHAEAEELRAFLRDVSETAILEARRLELELARVSEAVAQAAAPASPDQPYKRCWSTKP